MKSVGEVMGVGRTFEEAYQKAIRILDLEYEGVTSERIVNPKDDILDAIKVATPKRRFAIALALKKGISIKKIHELSGIDPWFLYRIKNIVDHEITLIKTQKLSAGSLRTLKQLGFSDKRIGEVIGKTGLEIRALRKKWNIVPAILQIDTLAAEFTATTNYLYTTYNANHKDVTPSNKDAIIVLGSGPYHIGSSVEF